jgi:ankyrin repeat protein/L-ascorbate metabolism protein UlaG (beta-lactamase superfamily)
MAQENEHSIVEDLPTTPFQEFKRLIEENPSFLETTGSHQETLLHKAVLSNQIDKARFLLSQGLDPNTKDDYGRTPLMYACQRKNQSIASLLLKKGADLAATDNWGMDAMYIATRNAFKEGMALLLSRGTNMNHQNRWGLAPLHLALRDGSSKIAQWLLENGADANLISNWGTPLQVAIKQGSSELVSMLLSYQADVNQTNDVGNTPVHTAVYHDEREILDTLVQQDANLYAFNDLGYQPIHIAAIHGYIRMARYLKEQGVDWSVVDQNGNDPLYYAKYYDYERLARVLAGKEEENYTDQKPGEKYTPYPDELRKGEARIFYTGHSGWAIETRNYYLIFDYYPYLDPDANPSLFNGNITLDELIGKPVLVFITHEHADHYNSAIYQWEGMPRDVEYIYGWEAFDEGEFIHFDKNHQVKNIRGAKITNVLCDDGGSSFHVQADGLTIYHSGDYSGDMESDMNYLSSLQDRVDLAFVGIDYQEIVRYTLRRLEPQVAFPMHKRLREIKYQEFKQQEMNRFPAVQIIPTCNRGDRYFYQEGKIQPITLKSTIFSYF